MSNVDKKGITQQARVRRERKGQRKKEREVSRKIMGKWEWYWLGSSCVAFLKKKSSIRTQMYRSTLSIFFFHALIFYHVFSLFVFFHCSPPHRHHPFTTSHSPCSCLNIKSMLAPSFLLLTNTTYPHAAAVAAADVATAASLLALYDNIYVCNNLLLLYFSVAFGQTET